MALTDEKIEEALLAHHGLVAVAARALGVRRETVHVRIGKSERLKQVLKEAREITVDQAESKLIEAIDEREGWAIKYFLGTQARHRGYTNRSEIDMTSGGEPLPSSIVIRHEVIDPAKSEGAE